MNDHAHEAEESPLEVVFDHIHARGRGDADAIEARMHPEVVHQGIDPDWICDGRGPVMERMRRVIQQRHGGVDWLELTERRDRVIAGFGGPRFADDPNFPEPRRFIVFTVRDGLITRMEDYRTREDAFAAVARS